MSAAWFGSPPMAQPATMARAGGAGGGVFLYLEGEIFPKEKGKAEASPGGS